MSTQQANFDQFINTLIDQRGYAEAAPEIRKQMQQDLAQRLDTFIIKRMTSEFSQEDLNEFEKMLDEGKSPAELRKFATEHIPDYTAFLTSTLLLFQEAYLS